MSQFFAVLHLIREVVLAIAALGFFFGLVVGILTMVGTGADRIGAHRARVLEPLDRWLNAEADRGEEILREERHGAPGERDDRWA